MKDLKNTLSLQIRDLIFELTTHIRNGKDIEYNTKQIESLTEVLGKLHPRDLDGLEYYIESLRPDDQPLATAYFKPYLDSLKLIEDKREVIVKTVSVSNHAERLAQIAVTFYRLAFHVNVENHRELMESFFNSKDSEDLHYCVNEWINNSTLARRRKRNNETVEEFEKARDANEIQRRKNDNDRINIGSMLLNAYDFKVKEEL